MGKRGPGVYHKPLNDGAGWNYGIASFTQKWNMADLIKYLNKNYPQLGSQLKGTPGTAEFNKSWAALGKSNEQEFFDAQLKYLLISKLEPALNKIKSFSALLQMLIKRLISYNSIHNTAYVIFVKVSGNRSITLFFQFLS